MSLVQRTLLRTGTLDKITLEYGNQPVKLTVQLKDGKQHIFTAEEHRDKVSLLLDAKVLQEKMGF